MPFSSSLDPRPLVGSITPQEEGLLRERFSALFARLIVLAQPIQDRLYLKRFHVRPQRQDARRYAGEMGRGPARRRLVGKGSELSAAVGLKLDLLAQLVGKPKRIAERILIYRNKRR